MIRSAATALEWALALHQSPRRAAEARAEPLPDDVSQVLRIAAGEPDTTAVAVEATGLGPEMLREAAAFWLQQVLFDADADSFRVLGVDAAATDAQIKLHYRWLMHWLHPDRNRAGWETVFADRVNIAWNDLRAPQRRLRYEAGARARAVVPSSAPERLRPAPRVADPDPAAAPTFFSARSLRLMPQAVLGTLAIVAVVAVVILHRMQPNAPDDASATPAVATTATARADVLVAAEREAARREEARREVVEAAEAARNVAIAPARPTPREVAVVPASTTVPVVAAAVPRSSVVGIESANLAPMPAPPRAPEFAEAPPRPPAEPLRVRAATGHRSPSSRDRQALASSTVLLPSRDDVAPRSAKPTNRQVSPRATTVAVATPAVAASAVAMPLPPVPRPASPTTLDVAPLRSDGGWIDEARAHALVQRFSERYERGDVDALRVLFVADPDRHLRGTLRDYQRLIAQSDYRRIDFDRTSWLADAGTASIITNYTAIVIPAGAPRGQSTRGVIRFDLRNESGEPRIYRLRQEASQ